MNRISLVSRRKQSAILCTVEKPDIIWEEIVNAAYEIAGVVTDGVLANGIRVNVGGLR